eukprot:c19106_g1_i1 orf=591-5369(-)
MQSQSHVGGQHGQTPQVFKGAVPLSKRNAAACWKPWHSDNDYNLRMEIYGQITKLMQKYGLENRLPTVAQDLESILYSDADSKEEYRSLLTLECLERRIWLLMSRLRNSQKATQHGALPGSVNPEATLLSANNNSYSSSGAGRVLSGPRVLLSTGSASTPSTYDVGSNTPMIGFNNNLFASSAVQPPLSGFSGLDFENKELMSSVSMPKAGSRMIPTPGLNTGGEVSSNPIRSLNASDGSADKIRQQLSSMGANGQTFSVTNFQRDGLLRNNAELANMGMSNALQVMRSDQMFVSNGSALNGSLYCQSMKQGYGQVPLHYPHDVDQSLPHPQYGGDIYTANSTDIMDGRSFQNPSMPTCANSSSVVPRPANPYPVMLSEHPHTNLSHNHTQHVSQTGGLPNSPTISAISQEHQQSGRTLVISNQNFKDSDTFMSYGTTPPSSAQDIFVEMLAGQQDQHQRRNQLFYLQQHHHHQQQHQHQQHPVQAFENKEKILLETDAGNQSFLQSESQNLQKHCPQLLSVDQHSEQTCQASSADTGQSEVVSNDESLAPRQVKDTCKLDQSTLVKQQRWLLVLFWHVNRCTNSGQCSVAKCESGHAFWKHITTCRKNPCRCTSAKQLLIHHNKCRDSKCVVCGPVRSYLSPQAVAARCKLRKPQVKQPVISCVRGAPTNEAESPPVKRVKLEVVAPGAPLVSQQEVQLTMSKIDSEDQACCQGSSLLKIESPTESSVSAGSHLQGAVDSKLDQASKTSPFCLKEDTTIPDVALEVPQTELKVVTSSVAPVKVSSDIVKPTKKKVSGITYLECLTSQQIRQHISSLRKWIGQSKVKAEKNQAMERHMSTSACSACAVETLHFDPIPVFCTQCGSRIKRNAIYYTSGSNENSLSFCGPCYNTIRSDTLETDGFKVQKAALEKKKNDEQRVEAWVECDKCKKWQHQICALFNARINKERSEYVCPECCIEEIERGDRVPQAVNSVLGAKDLPRTVLSDFVEERLAWKLEHEKAERAQALGKCPEEIPTAEGLVVRVISSVDKKLEVKPKFLEIFQQEDYPKDFVYKSKMLMLFQEIEGVEVCLFGMYVQEFGAESPQPNHRHVYLSYLDSVKYFRPDVKTITGEALRTYVYHEILIAYLDYCKRRGFSSCYIWACPPLKGDDYILYCHPEIQKTPKTDKLREWYLSMIAKAKKENIVNANKNLYDYFFTSSGECKAKVTAARLPYFDGDYWPGAAEDILQQLQEEEEGIHSSRRGKIKKLATKRTTKTSAQADVTGSVSKDSQLMQKLGQSIVAMKEDFIMVHLHHTCSRCRNFIISGHRWVCQLCGDNFQLCGCCHDEHEKLGEEERHPAGKKECHSLLMEEVNDVPSNTLDRDEIMECEYFDNRQAFLSLCQGNQYQYDTLRRAKHSSMMILYHLHNPNAPAFISSCTICHVELEACQGWKCKTCSDYDVCNGCYSSKEVQRHPHKLVARTIPSDQDAANADDRKQRILQLRMMLEVLVHASKCREASCQFAKCRNMKDLFRHGFSCSKRAVGGCSLCKRMWFLLTAHARSCKESVCTVPRCMDLRRHLRRAQQQQESRRRAAVNEMIRMRAKETAEAEGQ